MAEGLLIKQEKYLETGIHIGTKLRTIDMARFIYRMRNDGLYVLDLRKVDERIRLAGKVLSKYEPSDIVIIASRTYSSLAAKAFAKLTGCKVVSGRFIPGTFTNVARDDFTEPKLVFVSDPKGERQAVVECGKMGIPTVGLCDTDNFTMFIDWAIPCNNKGRRSLSLIFWLLARELAMTGGKVSSYDEFKLTFEEFEELATKLSDEEKKDEEADKKVEEIKEEEAKVEKEKEKEESEKKDEKEAGKKKEEEGKESEKKDEKEEKEEKPSKKPKHEKKAPKQEEKPDAEQGEKPPGEKDEISKHDEKKPSSKKDESKAK
ncbi:MAG: 30S ribosomal protein S2 [Candidatus Micrarchaeota archaeon]